MSIYLSHIGIFILIFLVFITLISSVRIAQEYQRAVIFRFGREVGIRGPGLFFKIPYVERAVIVDMRTITRQLETQETVTRDGVAVKINAVMWYSVIDATLSVIKVVNFDEAIRQAAETAMRDTIGQNELDYLLHDRVTINKNLKSLLDASVGKWGAEVSAVELKDLDIPSDMQRAIAKEAEAVREKRARIIKAEGEMEASIKLSEAAVNMAKNPIALELRRLQTLSEIGAEHNSTIVVSMPTTSMESNIGIVKALADSSLADSKN